MTWYIVPALNLSHTSHAQHLKTARYDLDGLQVDRDLSDLSDEWFISVEIGPTRKTLLEKNGAETFQKSHTHRPRFNIV